MKRWKGIGVVLAIALLALVAWSPPALALTVQRIDARMSCTAGEALAAGQPVMQKSDGLCYKADADDSTLRPAVGVAGNTVASGAGVTVVTAGQVGGLTTQTIGGAVYLSTTAGGTTQTEPGAYSQKLGQAISATQYLLRVQPEASSTVKARILVSTVENLAAGADIGDGTAANARTVWSPPVAVTITDVKVYGRAAAAGVDDANTAVVKVYNGTSTVVTKTYNTANAFPAAFTPTSLGTMANAAVPAGTAIKFDAVNGATADLPAFDLYIEYTTGN